MIDGPDGEFLFVGSDGVYTSEFGDKFGGSINMDFSFVLHEDFFSYLRNMTPESSNYANPWLMYSWMRDYDCTFDQDSIEKQQCEPFVNQPLKNVYTSSWLGTTFDGFLCYLPWFAQHNNLKVSRDIPKYFTTVRLLRW